MNVFINNKYPQNFNAKLLCLEQILMFGQENSVFKKRPMDGELIHKKYKATKSMRTHVTKEHNNWDTTNTLIKLKIVN